MIAKAKAYIVKKFPRMLFTQVEAHEEKCRDYKLKMAACWKKSEEDVASSN